MSRPRPVLDDRSCHAIRNARNGTDFFLPNFMLRWCFMFLLAAMSRRYNIGIVAYALMPTHIHIVVNPGEDPSRPSDLPEFKKQLLANWAKIINAYWDRKGHVMCRDSVGDCIRIVDQNSELQQISYVECNGVAAGLGRRPEDLKGAISQRTWLTQPQTIARPPFYFQERTWADEEKLKLCVPKLFAARGVSPEEFQKMSQQRLLRDLRRLRKNRQKAGKGQQNLRQLEHQRPTERLGRSAADHSQALLVGEDNVAKAEEFQRLEAFWSWHADALKRARDGEEGVVFPPGTYKAVRKYGGKVASSSHFRPRTKRRERGRLESKYDRKVANDAERTRVALE